MKAESGGTGFQAGLLLSVGLAVVGVLWFHASRTAESSISERVLSGPLDIPAGRRASRSDLRAFFAKNDSFARFPPVGDRKRIKNLLPAGKTFAVLIKGGLAGRLKDKDYGVERKANLAYVFEVGYRSTIEANNGHRVVERRCFETVRMAKLLSAQEVSSLDLGPPGAPLLETLRFPGPGNGISVTPVERVARSILAGGHREVVQCPTSRAFVEEDPLSGKSVRLTHVDGVGVVSIEPLGSPITTTETTYLFGQQLLASCHLVPHGSAERRESWKADVRHLAWLADPTVFVHAHYEFGVVPISESGKECARYAILRPSREARFGGVSEAPQDVPMGTFDYGLTDGLLRAATVQWPLEEFEPSADRLLFERDFLTEPTFTVQYSCVPVE